MDLLRKKMLLVFFSPIIISLVMVVLYETDIMLAGNWVGNSVMEYYLVGTMELVTVCSIPLALRLFKFKFVDKQIVANPHDAVMFWGVIRADMIGIPMVFNTVLYYQFLNVAFGYMAIIDLLCLAFIYPSEARCRQEMKEPE